MAFVNPSLRIRSKEHLLAKDSSATYLKDEESFNPLVSEFKICKELIGTDKQPLLVEKVNRVMNAVASQHQSQQSEELTQSDDSSANQ